MCDVRRKRGFEWLPLVALPLHRRSFSLKLVPVTSENGSKVEVWLFGEMMCISDVGIVSIVIETEIGKFFYSELFQKNDENIVNCAYVNILYFI